MSLPLGLIRVLFPSFPREIATPFRQIVRSLQELVRLALYHMSQGRDVYVSLYDVSLVLDKVWIEFDSSDLSQSYADARLFWSGLRRMGVAHVVVFSGRKGFHIHVLTRPFHHPDVHTLRLCLRYALYFLLTRACQEAGIDLSRLHTLEDVSVLTDLRRVVRLPGTRHSETRLHAVALPGLDLSLRDIITRARHGINEWEIHGERPDIRDLAWHGIQEHSSLLSDISEESDIDLSGSAGIGDIIDYASGTGEGPLHFESTDHVVEFLRWLVRPCQIPHLVGGEPPHVLRFNLVAELVWAGLSEEEIVSVCRALGWVDYNEKITRYQVRHIITHRYRPLSCRALSRYVNCVRCGWRYIWK